LKENDQHLNVRDKSLGISDWDWIVNARVKVLPGNLQDPAGNYF